jgi:Dynamin family
MLADRDGTLTTVVGPDFHDGTQESRLVVTLHRVREISMQEHRNDLAAAIDEELKHIARARALTVVVAAEVSRGKSLLVNALLEQEDLLPVDVDVSTGVYVLVQHGELAAARVFTRASPEPTATSLGALGEWVSVAGNPGNARDVAYVEVDVPAPLLGEGLSFIDTPGVGGLDAAHGAMTLAALSDADALIFVLDASAPLSRPELNFLSKASQRIESVILVLTKTDVFPGWRTILDENRQLLQQHAPRFADQEIIPVRSPLRFEAMRRQAAGDVAGKDRFLERSGIPLLVKRLREDLLQRSDSIRIANAHRLALSVLWQLDAGYQAQLATLSGDTSPLRALQDRQRELAEQRSSAERWRQAAMRGFTDVDVKLTRELQEAIVDFRSRFDDEITAAWRPGRQLSFPAELEADLRLVEIVLQRRLAECLRECAGQQAARIGIDEASAPTSTLVLPVRDRMAVQQVIPSQLAAVGGQLLSGAVGLLQSVLSFSPLYVFSGVLGLATSLVRLQSQRSQRAGEQTEARRLLQAYVDRFQQDCKTAIDEAVLSATDTTTEALQAWIQSQLQALQVQIQDLTERAAEVKEAEAARALLTQKRAAITTLEAENQASFDALSAGQGFAAKAARPEDASSGKDYGTAGPGPS